LHTYHGLTEKMSDQLSDPKYSIRHANRHIDALESEIATFFKTKPYAKVLEFDSERVEDVYKIKLVRPMPDIIRGITFDAVSSLRAALDQTGYAVAIAVGTRGKKAHFPFGDTLADVNSLALRGSRDIPKDIFDLMVHFQPYKGGHDTLWAINKLCNSHKHETVQPTAHYMGGGAIDYARFEGVSDMSFPPAWDHVKNEMVLFRIPHRAKFEINARFVTDISIAKTGVIDGQPVVAFLRHASGIVESIVMAVEAEARRLGIFS